RRDFAALGLGAVALPALAHDAGFDALTESFLEALWKLDPDAAVAAGRFEFAPLITPPSDAQRRKTGSFLNLWLNRFERLPDAP
ncbi:hypothetical protein Q6272_31320, partial [Klebsiella pneumoniae]